MAKQKKSYSIDKAYKAAIGGLITLAVGLIATCIAIYTVYFNTNNRKLIYIIFGISLVVLVLNLWVSLVIVYHNRKTLYRNLYKTTKSNYEHLLDQQNTLERYNGNFSAFDDLNNIVGDLESLNRKSTVFTGGGNYNEIPFDYINADNRVVTYDSFKKYYKRLIVSTLVYRSAIVSLLFNTNEKPITNEEKDDFISRVVSIFAPATCVIADNTQEDEFILFIPNFDSIDHLKEQLTDLITSCTIVRYGTDGYTFQPPAVSVVVYPYSSIDNILVDLEYAKHIKEPIAIYLPSKAPSLNKNQFQVNMNINFIGRVLEEFAQIDLNDFDSSSTQTKFKNVINRIMNYYAFDQTYIFKVDEDGNLETYLSYEKAKDDKKHNIKKVNKEFLDSVIAHLDPDHSYYFSNRNTLNNDIGREFDIFNISSGYLHVVYENDVPTGLIAFTKFGELNLDSYLREALFVFSRTISNLLYYVNSNSRARLINHRLINVLKIFDSKAYSVDKRNLELKSVSVTLKEARPNAKIGQHCYEAIYGRNKQCTNCPLKTGRKMYENLGSQLYESSLALSMPKDNEKTLLLVPVKNEDFAVRERFDKDLLCNSYYSFLEHMGDDFSTAIKGFVVVCSIDNYKDLVETLNPESFNEYLRSFFKNVTEQIPSVREIFYKPSDTFMFMLPNGNRKDIFKIVEKMFTLSKQNYEVGGKKIELKLTYLAHSYPFGYQNSTEYVRFVLNSLESYDKERGQDKVILPEYKYVRCASHEAFLANVLETSLDSSTFSIKLQPMVNRGTHIIESAEMLLRVPETYQGGEMNTFDIINAAAANNKIASITNILIEHIGNLYKDYEEKLFNRFGIKHLHLNTDYSFFEDPSFIERIKEMEKKFGLPKGFLVFEIREDEIDRYQEKFAPIARTLAKNQIGLVCDNYTGKNVAVKKLNELGFTGIKIDRKIVDTLDTNENAIESVFSYVKQANNYNMFVTLVGVERKAQYDALTHKVGEYKYQGYYFHRPLDAEEFINALLKTNTKR